MIQCRTRILFSQEMVYLKKSQRYVLYLNWPISPSYMSPNAGWGGEVSAMSTAVTLCTWRPNILWSSISIFNLWCNQKYCSCKIESKDAIRMPISKPSTFYLFGLIFVYSAKTLYINACFKSQWKSCKNGKTKLQAENVSQSEKSWKTSFIFFVHNCAAGIHVTWIPSSR